eukprot:c22272_g1_i1.p1 GENE.c22272_g1_i1~~c22272_g1_i1.p1  ORF type:complete len:107 (-),score=45.01 c22272_g1_i1:102-392(-)
MKLIHLMFLFLFVSCEAMPFHSGGSRPLAPVTEDFVTSLSTLLVTNGQGSGFSLNSMWMPLVVMGLNTMNNKFDGLKSILPVLLGEQSSTTSTPQT